MSYKVRKVQSLPGTPEANTVYYVKGSSESAMQVFVTNNTGTIVATPIGVRALATTSAPTHIPVFTADPSSTTRSLVTRTPAEFRGDIGAIGGTGTRTENYVAKFGSGGNTIQNSQIFDNGTFVGINTSTSNGSKLRVNGDVWIDNVLSFQALQLNSVPTHIPVFQTSPTSSTQTIYSRTIEQFRSDLGSLIARGVRSNTGTWLRTIDNVNNFSLWQDNFDWLTSYYDAKRIIQAETTGILRSTSNNAKVFTVRWGLATTTEFNSTAYNSNSYCSCLLQVGSTTADVNVVIKGTITITNTSEVKMMLEVSCWQNQLVIDRQINVATISRSMLDSNHKIAFTGILNTTGTQQWEQQHTFLTVL
jgi:hypothetical protein